MKSIVFVITCIIVMLLPLMHGQSEGPRAQATYDFIGSFQGHKLSRVAITGSEFEFYADFPGATGFFTVDGRPGQSVFLRYTDQPTRLLHSAEGCYRASGFEVEFTDNVLLQVEELSDEALQWSQFRINGEEKPFLIRQCILSLSTGQTYADVPAWYWQTTFSSDDNGPWLAVTWKLREPVDENQSVGH